MIQSLKKLIGNKKKKLNNRVAPEKEVLFYLFQEVIRDYFGKIGLNKMSPRHFSEGVLFIDVQNSAWSLELLANCEQIAREINKKIGEKFVREIKINNKYA